MVVIVDDVRVCQIPVVMRRRATCSSAVIPGISAKNEITIQVDSPAIAVGDRKSCWCRRFVGETDRIVGDVLRGVIRFNYDCGRVRRFGVRRACRVGVVRVCDCGRIRCRRVVAVRHGGACRAKPGTVNCE